MLFKVLLRQEVLITMELAFFKVCWSIFMMVKKELFPFMLMEMDIALSMLCPELWSVENYFGIACGKIYKTICKKDFQHTKYEWNVPYEYHIVWPCSNGSHVKFLVMMDGSLCLLSQWMLHWWWVMNRSLSHTHQCQAQGWTDHKYRFWRLWYDPDRNEPSPLGLVGRVQPKTVPLSWSCRCIELELNR